MPDYVLIVLQILCLSGIFFANLVGKYFPALGFYRPSLLGWCFLLVTVFAVIFVSVGAISLGKNARITPVPAAGAVLRRSGAFGIVRHPMYTGMIVAGLSWGIFIGSKFALASALALAFVLYLKAKREEKYLVEVFGETYRQYQKEVGLFFPKFYNF